MCIICIEFNRNRLNLLEARRALGELKAEAKDPTDKAHYEDLSNADDDNFKKITSEYAAANKAD